jgi:hypothetical protein
MTWPFIDWPDGRLAGEPRQGSALGPSGRAALGAITDGDQPRHVVMFGAKFDADQSWLDPVRFSGWPGDLRILVEAGEVRAKGIEPS